MGTSDPRRALPELYYEPCLVCGAQFDEACRDKHAYRMQRPHKARYDQAARADLLAWKNLGARKTG